jgi:hypothetical protein
MLGGMVDGFSEAGIVLGGPCRNDKGRFASAESPLWRIMKPVFPGRSAMAKARQSRNGRLEEALATLVQNQAVLVQAQAAFLAQKAESDRRMAESDQRMAELDRRWIEVERRVEERFVRIEAILMEHSRIFAEHSRILADHSRILQALPDLVRDKIGFKPPT